MINFPKSIKINLFVPRVINDQRGNSKAFKLRLLVPILDTNRDKRAADFEATWPDL